jgi:hypothetical protein
MTGRTGLGHGPVGAPSASRRDIWSDHPSVDLMFTAVLIGVHAWMAHRHPSFNLIALMTPSHRFIIYGALATVVALAAGSNNTAVASYNEASGEIVDQMRRVHGRTLRKNFRSVGLWLWTVAVLSLLAIVVDGGSRSISESGPTHASEWLFEFGFFLAAMKFARLTFLQDLVLKANDLSSPKLRQRSIRKWTGSGDRKGQVRKPSSDGQH